MRQAGTGLRRPGRKSTSKPRRINRIPPELVFRQAHHKRTHNPKKISALLAELVFRDTPGESWQWRRQTERFRGLVLALALVQPPGDGVLRVAPPPTGLRLLPPRRLTLRPITCSLPPSYSRVGSEPSPADGARSLAGAGLGHGGLSTSPRSGPKAKSVSLAGSFLESRGGLLLAGA
jgi:hypothetical protein